MYVHCQVEDIRPINRLPCVEQLLLIGNPVTITLDYRTKTLALFGDRSSEVNVSLINLYEVRWFGTIVCD